MDWLPRYQRTDLRSDLVAGLTVGAMLVPQAMAYALLAGLPPEVGLYGATIPVVIYALFGTSRQLAVGPVAIVSLMIASALSSVVEEGTADYLEAAALLALMVGVVHLILGVSVPRQEHFIDTVGEVASAIGDTHGATALLGFSAPCSSGLLRVLRPPLSSWSDPWSRFASSTSKPMACASWAISPAPSTIILSRLQRFVDR
jgi:SulP family sulfate permease